MSVSLLEPVELRARGFDVLVKSLGWVNAVRFIQQFEKSGLNYTVEREGLLPNWDATQLIEQMRLAREAANKSGKSRL